MQRTEFFNYLKDYAEAFHEGFPMFQLGRSRTEEEVAYIISRCLKEKKDVYALGYLDEKSNRKY